MRTTACINQEPTECWGSGYACAQIFTVEISIPILQISHPMFRGQDAQLVGAKSGTPVWLSLPASVCLSDSSPQLSLSTCPPSSRPTQQLPLPRGGLKDVHIWPHSILSEGTDLSITTEKWMCGGWKLWSQWSEGRWMMEATLCNDLEALSHHHPMWKLPRNPGRFEETWKLKEGRQSLGRNQWG